MSFVKNRRVIVSLCILALLVASGIILLRQFNKPVNAAVFTTGGNPAVAAPPQPVLVTGAYAQFSYPGSMQPMAGMQGPTGDEVESYNYSMPNVVPWHLAITIDHLHEPGLEFDANYLSREEHPTEFQASTVTDGANTFTVMTDTQAGGFSKVAFALHGDLSADISLTGDDSSGGSTLALAFQQVLQSWQWK